MLAANRRLTYVNQRSAGRPNLHTGSASSELRDGAIKFSNPRNA